MTTHWPPHSVVARALVSALLATVLGPAAPAAVFAATSISTPHRAVGASTSFNCTAKTFTKAQQLIQADLANRVTQLNTLITRVNRNTNLLAPDKAALIADLTQTELPGIQALQTKVNTDIACRQLREDRHSMFANYHVYLVMTPKTDLVIAFDDAIHAEAVLSSWETVASGAIQSAETHGTDVSDEQSAFSDYQANVAAAQNLTSSQSATLLAQTPQGWPGNWSVFLQARTNLSNAVNDLGAARNDLARIIQDLR